jgi:tetratricopeptide (TPR) repeat protein
MLSPGPVAGLAAGLVAGVGLWPWGNLQAQFHANLGAVSMARVELEGWPGARREDAARSSRLADAEAWFESSLASDPDNPTASFRMGLIALDRLEFVDACAYLENAWMNAERHRGVRKALGYCYTWLGRLEQAVVTLAPIPEAARELRVQARVWRGRGRPDLAQWATEVSTRLEASG